MRLPASATAFATGGASNNPSIVTIEVRSSSPARARASRARCADVLVGEDDERILQPREPLEPIEIFIHAAAKIRRFALAPDPIRAAQIEKRRDDRAFERIRGRAVAADSNAQTRSQ